MMRPEARELSEGERPLSDQREAGQLYDVAKVVIKPLFHAAWRFNVEGIEHVPAEGPAIMCPSHTSVLDSFFLPAVLPRRITYVGKAEYMDSWKTKYLFPALGMIPIDRSGGNAAERALAAAQRILERGELFGIYPEGTRSRDGKLHKGHTGPARLALRTGAPIVPVGIIGARDIMPPDASYPRLLKPVTVKFGPPISVERYLDRADDRMVLRQIIDEVMYEIRNLTGQEYVDEYATKKAEAVPVDTAQPQVEPGEAPTTSAATAAAGNGNSGDPLTPAAEPAAERPSPADTEVKPGRRPGGRSRLGAETGEAVPPRSSAEVLSAPRRRVREPSSS
jgi:1-acyl-sn-glycerol-3-phosphate acyltransferase